MNRIVTSQASRSLCALVVLCALTSSAQAKCKAIFADQRGSLTTVGCTSPVGFCAAGTLRGNDGLRGTSLFVATSFDPIPGDPLGRLAVPGTTVYTTDDGTLTISEVSAFDIQRGTFADVGRITGGTGRFAGATGDVFTIGRLLADGSRFTTEVSGEICLPD